jgi:Xaa-Pro aminopeptidase
MNPELYRSRRNELLEKIREAHPQKKDGALVLFAGFEHDAAPFRQEGSFFYLTGIREPGVVVYVELNGTTTLYTPNCGETRAQWVMEHVPLLQENADELGVDHVKSLGAACAGYSFHPFFPQAEYEYLLKELSAVVARGGSIFTLNPQDARSCVEQRLLLKRLAEFIPGLLQSDRGEQGRTIVDVLPLVAQLRRIKSHEEIEYLYKAIEITALAQEAAAHAIADGVRECEVQAGLEYIITGSASRTTFPSIVATGKNATVLHYTMNRDTLIDGDLVVVDCGAEFDYYCADITRTYPVSGKFTARQKELYTIVLETQEYIASIAKPGMWLSYKEKPDQSLNHLTKKFLKEKGYDQYMPHGIGHFLGIDVHDVGDYTEPLQEGDVITIEPGIYIPQEGIGIRIEDDYWIVKDGAVCLSEDIPKSIKEIEALVKKNL